MNEKTENSQSALPPVSNDATSAYQQDVGNTRRREITPTITPLDLNALVNRIMDGDTEPWDQVFTIFVDIATKYSWRLPPHVREEFRLDMGQRLVACLPEKRWQDTGKSFEAWIHTTAYNAVCEWRRTLKRRSPEVQDPEFPYEDVEDADSSMLDQMLQQEEKAFLWRLVIKLPEPQATVIYERYALEKSFSEISEKLGKTEINCRKIHQRALEALRKLAYNSGYYT